LLLTPAEAGPRRRGLRPEGENALTAVAHS
jgi:hypothetical protein